MLTTELSPQYAFFLKKSDMHALEISAVGKQRQADPWGSMDR